MCDSVTDREKKKGRRQSRQVQEEKEGKRVSTSKIRKR
jgi:hypothetical protein